MSRLQSIRYPFSPFKSWDVSKENILIARASEAELNKILSYSEINVVSFGGLWESFLSCSLFEYCIQNRISSKFKIFAPSLHKDLFLLIDSCEISDDYINCDLYPCPVFTLEDSNPYFNILHNVNFWGDIYGEKLKTQFNTSFKIIQNNLLFKWNVKYLPKYKNIQSFNNYDIANWAKNNNYLLEQDYAIIIPHRLGYSINSNRYLNFDVNQIKQIVHLFKTKNINCIIMDKDQKIFHNSLKFSIPSFIKLLPKAKIIMSNEIDFLNLSCINSNAAIICEHHTNHNSIKKITDNFSSRDVLSKKDLNLNDIETFINAVF